MHGEVFTGSRLDTNPLIARRLVALVVAQPLIDLFKVLHECKGLYSPGDIGMLSHN